MNKFFKVLGAAALIAGFAPYRVETDEETGGWKLKALLWQASKKPNPEGGKDDITVNIFSFGKDVEEPHLFSEDLEVEYSGKTAEPEEPAAPAEAAAAEEMAEPAEPEEPAGPAEE